MLTIAIFNMITMMIVTVGAASTKDWPLMIAAVSATCGWGSRIAYASDHP